MAWNWALRAEVVDQGHAGLVEHLHHEDHADQQREVPQVERLQRHRPAQPFVQPAGAEDDQRHESGVGDGGIQHLRKRHPLPQPVPGVDERRQARDPGRLQRAEDDDARDLGDAVEGYVAEGRVRVTDGDREQAEDQEESRLRPADGSQHARAWRRQVERDHRAREQGDPEQGLRAQVPALAGVFPGTGICHDSVAPPRSRSRACRLWPGDLQLSHPGTSGRPGCPSPRRSRNAAHRGAG